MQENATITAINRPFAFRSSCEGKKTILKSYLEKLNEPPYPWFPIIQDLQIDLDKFIVGQNSTCIHFGVIRYLTPSERKR